MNDFRHLVDLTPWDSSGGSWMGLTRRQAKWIAWFFIFVGLMLMDPPFGFLPNDWMNIGLATLLVKFIPSLSFDVWLFLTYTVIGFGFFMLGLWIYPYNTMSLFYSYLSKAKFFIKRVLRNPWVLIISFTIFYLFLKWYKTFFKLG